MLMITVNDLINKMLELFPEAVIEEDSNGEIVIYTGLKTDDNDNLVELIKSEEEN